MVDLHLARIDPAPRLSLGDIAAGLIGQLLPADPGPQGVEAAWLTAAARRLGPGAAQALARALADPAPADAPLARLARALDLTPAEVAAIALALAVETDAIAGRAIAHLQAPIGGARPCLGLIAAACAGLQPGPLVPHLATGAAVRAGVLRLDGTAPLPERMLALPEGLIAALSGAAVRGPGLTRIEAAPAPDWPPSLVAALEPYARGIGDGLPLLVVRGAAPGDRVEILARLAAGLGLTPVLVDPGTADLTCLGALCTAARLLPGFVVAAGPGEYRALPDLPGTTAPLVAFVGPEGSTGRTDIAAVEWTPPLPEPQERARLWAQHFPADLAEELGSQHLQSAARIREIGATARALARLGGGAPDAAILSQAIWPGTGDGLGSLAQPVRDVVPGAALVAAPALRADLGLLAARCRQRERLTTGLGAAIAARYKVGVRALFTGPSGTGKTLAAAWLAGRLAMPLYRVDLAAISSKYIGETEKNLATLLARAEEQEVVLLFDEADSLFGKRTEISDANDRFANAQTNYLLQRIETYTGIVLLTSNSKTRFDDAFTRRIDVIVDFGAPQPTERRALWHAHLGTGHALSDAEITRIAALAELAGGHIRNVVLGAAVLAAESGRPIALPDLMAALKIEYRKLGWTVPPELTGGGR